MVARLLELLDVASLDPDGLERVDRRPDRLVACAGVVRGRLQLVGADGGCHCVSAPNESVERWSSAHGQNGPAWVGRGESLEGGECVCVRWWRRWWCGRWFVDVSLAQSRSRPSVDGVFLSVPRRKKKTPAVCVDSFPADLERHRHEAAVRDRPQAHLTYRESVPGAASAGGKNLSLRRCPQGRTF